MSKVEEMKKDWLLKCNGCGHDEFDYNGVERDDNMTETVILATCRKCKEDNLLVIKEYIFCST